MQDEREKFEAHIRRENSNDHILQRALNDGYFYRDVQLQWHAWQARASLPSAQPSDVVEQSETRRRLEPMVNAARNKRMSKLERENAAYKYALESVRQSFKPNKTRYWVIKIFDEEFAKAMKESCEMCDTQGYIDMSCKLCNWRSKEAV